MPPESRGAPEDLPKERRCQVAFGELQGEVPGMPDEASARLEQPLLETFSGACQAIYFCGCRSCCRVIVARWYCSSYGTWRCHMTKMIFNHFAPTLPPSTIRHYFRGARVEWRYFGRFWASTAPWISKVARGRLPTPPQGGPGAPLHALQFRPDSQDAQGDPGHGSRRGRSRVVLGRDCCARRVEGGTT